MYAKRPSPPRPTEQMRSASSSLTVTSTTGSRLVVCSMYPGACIVGSAGTQKPPTTGPKACTSKAKFFSTKSINLPTYGKLVPITSSFFATRVTLSDRWAASSKQSEIFSNEGKLLGGAFVGGLGGCFSSSLTIPGFESWERVCDASLARFADERVTLCSGCGASSWGATMAD